MKKKLLTILLCATMFICLTGCDKEKQVEEPQNTNTNNNYTIVDTSKDIDGFMCAQALEEFYRDDKYVYSFSCIKSGYIIVKYEDGTEENIKDALKNKKVTIKDLDKYNIQYYKDKIK